MLPCRSRLTRPWLNAANPGGGMYKQSARNENPGGGMYKKTARNENPGGGMYKKSKKKKK